ncbi:preprotein translocase subunit YajC [Candidatus Purcelliella pentastirinorum]|uniref:Sec translocon accessory complex subunit YajC n=1 Tax=Candidatus Purcelliella pentastirinorum TaxID=472834 RepID=A0AAX3N910_9ENTR|nr:preprotein translocase subunit YajC [Candidatus Purcelliella pentastirinorum]WDI78340.1 preprotein translocase subunit YajC [Candidatus Purcelliella pentastirinorum]WDR80632.1 preprotein translocase subunit YajC [Candidatus Purcelliella pentastirinorum]
MRVFFSNVSDSMDYVNQSSSYSIFFMLFIFILVFYFLILRPQQKRSKEHKNIVESITKGEEILTTSGLIGRVVKINSADYITLLINSSTEVIIKRDFISNILPKGTINGLK